MTISHLNRGQKGSTGSFTTAVSHLKGSTLSVKSADEVESKQAPVQKIRDDREKGLKRDNRNRKAESAEKAPRLE